MNKVQQKVCGLMENYFEDCKTNGYSDFRVWCEDSIDTIDENALVADIYQDVNYIADKLFN